MARITELLKKMNESKRQLREEDDGELHDTIIDALHMMASGNHDEDAAREMIAQAIEKHDPTLSHVDDLVDGMGACCGGDSGLVGESFKKRFPLQKGALPLREMSPRMRKVTAVGAGLGAAGLAAAGAYHYSPSVHHAISDYIMNHPHAHAAAHWMKHNALNPNGAKRFLNHHLSQLGHTLFPSKYPDEAGRHAHPNYYPYPDETNRMRQHTKIYVGSPPPGK